MREGVRASPVCSRGEREKERKGFKPRKVSIHHEQESGNKWRERVTVAAVAFVCSSFAPLHFS